MRVRLPVAYIITVILGLLGIVVGGGCNDESSSSGPGQPVREVKIGYFANLTHAQAVLGVASGDFGRAVAPATVSTKIFNAGPSLVEALFAGEIDLGYIGPGPALAAHNKSRGQGLRVIAGAAANGVLIVARKDAGITKMADLAGKRVATPQHGNTQDVAARHYLKAELKQAKQGNVLPITNAEQVGLMNRKQIDAAWAPEPWGSFLVSEAGATVIGREQDLWPDKRFATVLVITTPEFLRQHPDVVERLLAVHRDWTRKLAESPDDHVPQLEAALFALTKKKLPPGVLRSAIPNVTFTDDPLEPTIRTMARWAFDVGFAREVTDTTGLIDTSILTKLRAAPAGAPATNEAAGAAR